MAWLSVGESHADLCQKLINHEILKQGPILDAFLATDRGDFVFPEDRLEAYQDRPYRRDFVHISAPHMYATVLEALSLRAGGSFLNIGSGSGYLSCLAASVLGERGVVQGIELNPSTVAHSRVCCSTWRERAASCDGRRGVCRIDVVEGDAFALDIAAQVVRGCFDRVYIGAACPESLVRHFLPLLRAGGVLVAPVEETHELVRIERRHGDVFERRDVAAVRFAPLVYSSLALPTWADGLSFYRHHRAHADDAAAAVVAATPLENVLVVPASWPPDAERLRATESAPSSFVLPAEVWRPAAEAHRRCPAEFRAAIYALLLCASSDGAAGDAARDGRRCAVQSRVPVAVWLHVVSFMTREWFSRQPSAEELLRAELAVERARCRQLEAALRRADNARVAAQREATYLRCTVDRLRLGGGSRAAAPASPWFIPSQVAGDEWTSDSDEADDAAASDDEATEDAGGDDGGALGAWDVDADADDDEDDGAAQPPSNGAGGGEESSVSGTPAQSSDETTETPRSGEGLTAAALPAVTAEASPPPAADEASEGPPLEALDVASAATDASGRTPLHRGRLKRPWAQDATDADDASVGAHRRPRCSTLGDLTDEDFGDA